MSVCTGREWCDSRPVWLQASPDRLRLTHKTTCYQMPVPNGQNDCLTNPLFLSPQIFQEFPITQVSGFFLFPLNPFARRVIPVTYCHISHVIPVGKTENQHFIKGGKHQHFNTASSVLSCPFVSIRIISMTGGSVDNRSSWASKLCFQEIINSNPPQQFTVRCKGHKIENSDSRLSLTAWRRGWIALRRSMQ